MSEGGGLAALAAAAGRPKPRIDTGESKSSAASKSDTPKVPPLKTPKPSKEKSERLKRLQEQRAKRRAAATPGGPRASKDEVKKAVAARERAQRQRRTRLQDKKANVGME